MRPYKVFAHINSLDGEMREVTVIDKKEGQNQYIVEYNGVKCTAIFNWFVCEYYADDKYGVINE